MENREDCKKVIEILDKANLPGNSESITVKFADSGSSRRKLSKCLCSYDITYGLLHVAITCRSLERLPGGESQLIFLGGGAPYGGFMGLYVHFKYSWIDSQKIIPQQ